MFYVYKVTINPTNQYYFGGQYNKNANSEALGTVYFTSKAEVQLLLFTHGIGNCTFEILEEFTDVKSARNLEEKLMSTHWNDPLCINVKRGVPIGYKHSEERNAKIATSMLNQWKDPTIRKHRSKSLRKRTWKLTPEQAARVTKNLTTDNTIATEAVRDSVWITDGDITKRIKKDCPIPDGFRRGRA